MKREPMLGTDVDAYAAHYAAYVAAARAGETPATLGLDPAPRAIIDPRLGVWAAGIDDRYVAITGEILRQDLEIKSRAAAHDRYAGLPPSDILDAELHYGGFERRIHAAGGPGTRLLGEVVVIVPDALPASEALRRAFQARGAAVVEVEASRTPDAGVLNDLAVRFGGIDVLVLAATSEPWIRALAGVLALAPRGGRVLVIDTDECFEAGRAVKRARELGLAAAVVRQRANSPITAEQAEVIANLCEPDICRSSPELRLGQASA